jgi:hypothetical protein
MTAALDNGEATPISFSLTLSGGFEETQSTDSHHLGSLLRLPSHLLILIIAL